MDINLVGWHLKPTGRTAINQDQQYQFSRQTHRKDGEGTSYDGP
jgi:hypothetical protein